MVEIKGFISGRPWGEEKSTEAVNNRQIWVIVFGVVILLGLWAWL